MSTEDSPLPSADARLHTILTARLGELQRFVLAQETLIHLRGKENRWNLSSVDGRLLLMMVYDVKESSDTTKEFKGNPNAPAAIQIHHIKDPSGEDLCHVVRRATWTGPPPKMLHKGRMLIETRFTWNPPIFDAHAQVQGPVLQVVECSPVEVPLPLPVRIVTTSYSVQDRALMFQSALGSAGRAGVHDFVVLSREGNVVANVANITPALSPLDRYQIEVVGQVNPAGPLLHILATLSTYDPLRAAARDARSVGY